jgi:hypothetical protein
MLKLIGMDIKTSRNLQIGITCVVQLGKVGIRFLDLGD